MGLSGKFVSPSIEWLFAVLTMSRSYVLVYSLSFNKNICQCVSDIGQLKLWIWITFQNLHYLTWAASETRPVEFNLYLEWFRGTYCFPKCDQPSIGHENFSSSFFVYDVNLVKYDFIFLYDLWYLFATRKAHLTVTDVSTVSTHKQLATVLVRYLILVSIHPK